MCNRIHDPYITVTRDECGAVRHLEHWHRRAPYSSWREDVLNPSEVPAARDVAEEYLRSVAASVYSFGFADEDAPARASMEFEGKAGVAADENVYVRFLSEKSVMETTSLWYTQVYDGLDIWDAGLTVQIQEDRAHVLSSTSTLHLAPVFAAPVGELRYGPESIDAEQLRALLGIGEKLSLIVNEAAASYFYLYAAAKRFDLESSLEETAAETRASFRCPAPTLPLPRVPEEIREGVHYRVTEVLFTLELPGRGELNWRALVEVGSGAVLYLRAFISCVSGMVFIHDPYTTTGDASITPRSRGSVLDPLRTRVTLPGIRLPAHPLAKVTLTGEFVQLFDYGAPPIPPPEVDFPGDFSFPVRTDDFSAVNAYFHCDGMFRLMQEMGFDVRACFDGTRFPVFVDHRDLGETTLAETRGNINGNGVEAFRFALAQVGEPVGIAVDVRVVMHEFCHALLLDSIHRPNLGFAHSAGDSLAAILNDPENRAPRSQTFPWFPAEDRNHERSIADGFAWGGPKDSKGYNSEQILSTTLFRFYRAIGGDAAELARRKFAARYSAYLIIRAILSLVTKPRRPEVFVTALLCADRGTTNFAGHPGGVFHKVLRWSFEKQGLFQPAGAPTPVMTEGDPPAVDVFIEDGRGGEYAFREEPTDAPSIWNRLSADDGQIHETPVAGVPNFAYVRVSNRGRSRAENVVVRGFQSTPLSSLIWPTDWQPLTTPQLNSTEAVARGEEVVVGPFEWTPLGGGEVSLLMSVSAAGDLSNIDPQTPAASKDGPIAARMLVPFDNNLAMRRVL
jgi:zinc metalloprotease ZmpB